MLFLRQREKARDWDALSSVSLPQRETVSFYHTQGLGSHCHLHISYWGTNPVVIDQHLKQIPLSKATHELLLSLELFLHLIIQLLHLPLVSQLYFSRAISDMKLAMQNQSFYFTVPQVKIIYPSTLSWIRPTVQAKRPFLILQLKSFF